MDLVFDTFRIFGFIDDFGMPTLRPGDAPTRRLGFRHDIQMAYYSGYFKEQGLKAQAVFLPNGMYRRVYIDLLAQNNKGMLNKSGLDQY